MQHLPASLGAHTLRLTPLGVRALGATVSAQPQTGTPQRLSLEDAVSATKRLVESWDQHTSDQLIARITRLQQAALINGDANTLEREGQLQVLRALAHEKALLVSHAELEGNYHEARERGRLHSVVILNNLGVISAKQPGAPQAIDFFKAAIREALAYDAYLRAPFYNLALVLDILRQRGFVFHASYEKALTETAALVTLLQEQAPPSTPDIVAATSTVTSRGGWTHEEITEICTALGRHGHNREHGSNSWIDRWASYIDPEFDFFESFGDQADVHDRTGGRTLLDDAERLADSGAFKRALIKLETVPIVNPDLRVEAQERRRRIGETWRRRIDTQVREFSQAHRFAEAAKLLGELDPAVQRDSDGEFVRRLRMQEQERIFEIAVEAVRSGDWTNAYQLLRDLLRQELTPELHARASALFAMVVDHG